MTQPFQRPCCCNGVPTPVVYHSSFSQACLQLPWVCLTQLLDGFEHFFLKNSQAGRLPWLQQLPDPAGQETIGVENVFLEVQFRITAFEVASAIALRSMTKDQILGACRRPNWVCLNESHSFNRRLQCRRLKERF